MSARFGFLTLVTVLLLALFAGSCGGGTNNVGLNSPNLSNSGSERQVGVVTGGFEVIRQNQQGYNDQRLNQTLGLELQTAGNETILVINVSDSSFTNAVTLDINYDATRFHPVRAEFTDLLGGRDQVLTAAFLESIQGSAGLGAAAIGDYVPGPLSGELARVYFAPGPDRAVSAAAGDAHENPLGVADILDNVSLANLTVDTSVADTVSVTWTSAWMIGNGDGNKEVNAADLVPIAAVFQQSTNNNFAAVRGDYDRNTEANAADLVKIAQFFRRFTDAYLIEASDNTGSGTVVVATLDGATDQQPAQGPPTAGVLTSVFPFWNVTFAAGQPFTYAQLQALDVNTDGEVRISITPLGPAGALNGVKVDVDVTVGSPVPPTNQMVLTGLSISVNDGAATPAEIAVLNSAANTLTVEANSSIGFTLNAISGTYNGVNFDGRPATDPTEAGQLTQAHYDLAFAAARDNLITNFTTGGDASARRSSEWVTFASGSSPYTGVLPTPGTVFPDWDPESVLPTSPEGTMSCSLPTSDTANYPSDAELNVQVIGSPVVQVFRFDVELDPRQPYIPDYFVDNQGFGGANELVLNRRNTLRLLTGLEWGADGVPANLATVSFELRRIGANGTATGSPVVFTYSTEVDDAALQPGQFNIVELPSNPPLYGFNAVVNMSALTQGANYALRMRANGRHSTLNLPDILLTVAPPPPPQPLAIVPSVAIAENDSIQIMYLNPSIRRNGAMVDRTTPPPDRQTFFEAVNPSAFNDALRINGDEFSPAVDNTTNPVGLYPRVVIKDSTLGAISGPDDPQQAPGTSVIERGVNRIVVDVAVLTLGGGGPGDEDKLYNVLVYGQDGVELGGGSFTYSTFADFPIPPSGLEWGVNAANREEIALADLRFDPVANPEIRNCDGTLVGSDTPPVLFFKFVGGSPFDHNQNEEEIYADLVAPTMNPYVFIEDPTDPRPLSMYLATRVAALAPDGAYILIHTITADAYSRPGFPGWQGILEPGSAYDMYLIDPKTNFSRELANAPKFPDQLLVVGPNPWIP
jgi:hypothetical protein